MIITMTAGAATLMWFGELITDRGVGNGMSLLIFVSIIAGMPGQFYSIYQTRGTFILLLTLAVGVVIIAAVVYVEQAQRRIPVQYAKKMVGSRLMGGASTYIPLKVNMAGVIPVIFASSLLYIPQLLGHSEREHELGVGQVHRSQPVARHRTALCVVLRGDDHLLRVLLRLDHVQPGRGQRQHEEVRRASSRVSGRASRPSSTSPTC
jgi:preprotein translocase subunit SecY